MFDLVFSLVALVYAIVWSLTIVKFRRLGAQWSRVADSWASLASSNRAIAETTDALVGRMEEELRRRELVIAQLMQEARVTDAPRCPRNHGNGTQCVRTVGHRGQHIDHMWIRWP